VRVLGIDYGLRRIGLALSDATGTLASPWRMVQRPASEAETLEEMVQQIEQLLAEESLRLGEEFDLAKFHDDFLAAGTIPVSLIRWEMTGKDDQVKTFFSRPEKAGPTK